MASVNVEENGAKERVRIVLEDLEQTLLEFIHKHRITHEEYRRASDTLVGSVKAGEESLLFDVFVEAATTDTGNINNQGSLEAVEGPFYLPNSPRLEAPCVLPQRSGEAGDVLFFHGRVTSPGGTPLAGVELDMWQADADGLYSNIHPNTPEWNLRGRFYSDANGAFEVRTIVPHLMRFRKVVRPGLCLRPLAGICFAPLTCM